MTPLAQLFERIFFPVKDYNSKNRTYRAKVEGLPVRAKIMAEKDVAIQVAVGNYDIGFCGLDWIKEHTVRYRATKLHLFKHLGLNKKYLHACTGITGNLGSVGDLQTMQDFVTIVSEYPNLAENFAITNRLRKFKVFSAWGSVEVYPPEHADVVLLAVDDKTELKHMGLQNLVDNNCDFESDLCLVVNSESFVKKNLFPVLKFF